MSAELTAPSASDGYPTITNGLDAEFAAHEHCSRSPYLFDEER